MVCELNPLLAITSQVADLKRLKPGWYDGYGVAPSHAGLDWFAATFARLFPSDLPRPHLYPTTEGRVLAEWSIRPHELSLEIDPDTRTGAWHALNMDDDTDREETFDLSEASGWERLATEVRQSSRAVLGVDRHRP